MTIDASLFDGAPRSLAFLRALEADLPTLRVVAKERDPFSKAIDRALRVVTLGGQSDYTARYTTVISRS